MLMATATAGQFRPTPSGAITPIRDKRTRHDIPMNELAHTFLETYARGAIVDGGWLFAKALQQVQLDYSDASLERLDRLLATIREQAKPSPEQLQATLPGRNFCSLLAFYLMEVLHRRTGAIIDWHDRTTALRMLPSGMQLPDGPAARLIAIAPDQTVIAFPLGWVEQHALNDGDPSTAEDFVAGIAAQIERNGPVLWATGMRALGRLASWQMMMAADGGNVEPTIMNSTAPKTFEVLKTGLFDGVSREILEWGGNRLEENQEGASWQVLSYDGYIDLDGDRLDAIIVILYTYANQPLRLKLAFPYRPARGARKFAILAPRLREATIENEQVAMLNNALEAGIQSIKWAFGTTWDQLREVESPPHHEDEGTCNDAEVQHRASGEHYVSEMPPKPEMEQAIVKVRSAYAQIQKKFTPAILASIRASTPTWMDKSDALNEVLKKQDLLYTEGTVVWGALIQANKLLFSPGLDDCPALLVYSNDKYFDARPQELRLIGRKIFALKNTSPSDPDLRDVAQLVSDEMNRSMSFQLPKVFSSRHINAAAFMVFRKHIPNGVLSAGLFPLLIHPSTEVVIIVPFEFWPIEMIIMWKEGGL